MSMRHSRLVTFVQEEVDIDALRVSCPQALDGNLVCFDITLHHNLKKQGVPHHTVSDFVSEVHHDALHSFFDELWTTWNTLFDPPITYRGVDPFQLAPTRHLYCLRRVAYAAFVIRRALDELAPDVVVCFAEPGVHGLEQPMGANRRMPLVQGMVQFEAACRDIEIIPVDRRGVPGHVPWRDVRAPQRHATRPRKPFRRRHGAPMVLVAGNENDLIQQQPLVREVRSRGTADVLHLGLVMNEAARARLSERGHPFHELGDVDVELSPLPGDELSLLANSTRAEKSRHLPDGLRIYFDNPYIDYHFEVLLGDYLRKMLVQIERWMTLFDRWQPELVVVNGDIPMAGVARACGIPVLGMMHGMMSPIDPAYHHWAHSHLAVLSPEQVKQAAANETDPDQVRATGHPDSDALFHLAADQQRGDPSPRDQFCQQYDIDPARRIVLLLTCYQESVTSSMAWFPNTNMRKAVDSWAQIARVADRHPDWQFIVKGHPRADHLDVYRDLLSNLKHHNAIVIGDVSLADVVPAADVAVVCNVTTSAQLEACFWRIPVVLLDDARCWLHRFHRDAFDAWPRVSTVIALEQWLVRTGEDAAFYSKQRQATLMAFQSFAGPQDGRASERVADFVQDIVLDRVPAGAV